MSPWSVAVVESSGVPTFHRMPWLPCCQEPAPATSGASHPKNVLLWIFSYLSHVWWQIAFRKGHRFEHFWVLPAKEREGRREDCDFPTFWMASVNPSHKYQVSSSLYFRCLKSGRFCPVGSNYHDNWGSCGSLGLEVPSSGWLLPRKWRGNFVTSHHLNVYDWNRNAKCILLHFWPFARLNSKMFRVL